MGVPLHFPEDLEFDQTPQGTRIRQKNLMPYDFSQFPQLTEKIKEEAPPKIESPTYDI